MTGDWGKGRKEGGGGMRGGQGGRRGSFVLRLWTRLPHKFQGKPLPDPPSPPVPRSHVLFPRMTTQQTRTTTSARASKAAATSPLSDSTAPTRHPTHLPLRRREACLARGGGRGWIGRNRWELVGRALGRMACPVGGKGGGWRAW